MGKFPRRKKAKMARPEFPPNEPSLTGGRGKFVYRRDAHGTHARRHRAGVIISQESSPTMNVLRPRSHRA